MFRIPTRYTVYFFVDNLGRPFYVGQTCRFKTRCTEHYGKIKKGKNLPHYLRAAYLIKNNLTFEIVPINVNLGKNQANVLELYYNEKFDLKQKEKTLPQSLIIHGKCGTQVYTAWVNMRLRCENVKNKEYFRYGKRGIKVCKRWQKFENFYLDMGDPPSKKHSLDRIKNNKGYCKTNCKWSTMSEQARNTRRTVMLTYQRKTLPMIVWGEKLGIPYYTLRKRIQEGWSTKKALETPHNNHRRFITYRGVTKSVNKWSKELGINKDTLKDRLFYMGWPPEKAFKAPKKKRDNYILTYRGVTKSLPLWAEVLGLNRNTLRDRINKGWSLEKAFTSEIKKPKTFTYKNKTKTLADWSKYLNINRGTLRDRLDKLRWSLEKALNYGVKNDYKHK